MLVVCAGRVPAGGGGEDEVLCGLAAPVGVEEEHAVVEVDLAVVGRQRARPREPRLGLRVARLLQAEKDGSGLVVAFPCLSRCDFGAPFEIF